MQHAATSFVAGIALVCAAAFTVADGEMAGPDPRFTRGAVVSTERDAACAWGHTTRLYDTDKAEYERQARYIFDLYGIPWSDRHLYELDHNIPRCLGGADAISNQWPQERSEALVKDRDERRICRAVCHAGTMSIGRGQDFFRRGEWR